MNALVILCSMVMMVLSVGAAPTTPEISSEDVTASLPTTITSLDEDDFQTNSSGGPYSSAVMAKIPCTRSNKAICAEPLHSSVDQVECVEGFCHCLYNHVYENDTCLRKKENGDDESPADKTAEMTSRTSEGSLSKMEMTSTTSVDKTPSTESPKNPEPDDSSTMAEESMSKPKEQEPLRSAVESESTQTTMGQISTLVQSPTMGQPSTMGEPPVVGQTSTMGQPTSMEQSSTMSHTTTPHPVDEVKEAEPSNVDPVEAPRDETTQRSSTGDKNSMQGDQPADDMAAKPTEMTKVGVLQNCTSSLQCDQLDAACIDGTCECKEGYVINPPRDRCLRVADKVGDSCEEDIQCVGNLTDYSYCKNQMCVCKEGGVQSGTKCAAPKGLGESCSTSSECHPQMQCDADKCACRQGSQPSEDKKSCIGEPAGATAESAPVPAPAPASSAAAIAAPTAAPAAPAAAPTAVAAPSTAGGTTTSVAPSRPTAPAATPAAAPTKLANQRAAGENGASTIIASFAVLCLGLLSSTIQQKINT